MSRVYHVAIADDWEASLALGSYEAASRGIPYEPGQPIRAVTADGVQRVLDELYGDLGLPLLLLTLDVEALAAAGSPVAIDPGTSGAAIDGPIPPGDGRVVRAITPLTRASGRWIAPDPIGSD